MMYVLTETNSGPGEPQPEPTTQGLYRDVENDWWVRRSDGQWALTHYKSYVGKTSFIPPNDESIDKRSLESWIEVPDNFKPFTFICPYPGV